MSKQQTIGMPRLKLFCEPLSSRQASTGFHPGFFYKEGQVRNLMVSISAMPNSAAFRAINEGGNDPNPTPRTKPMRRNITSAFAGALLLGLGTTAALAVNDEFSNKCAMGLASGTDIQTDCSINMEIQGKTYCFGSKEAMTQFMADATGN